MFAATATQVSGHTSAHLNEHIRHATEERIAEYEGNDRKALITRRLKELEHEWDVERTLQTNFATLSLIGLALALKSDKRWLVLAAGVPAFMVQHALQGWCPPLPLLRRLGVRTAREIAEERFALKSLRGDFDEVVRSQDPDTIVRAVRA
jgi:hypothetical protein